MGIRRGNARAGFTLFELLVVICIIIIMASLTMVLMNIFFRGQGVRQGGVIVQQTFAQCKQLAADKRRMHFIKFDKTKGTMTIYEDGGTPNRIWDSSDIEIAGRPYDLPKGIVFKEAPDWIGIEPSGYCRYGGKMDIPASAFEGALAPEDASPMGDIVLNMSRGDGEDGPYYMCLDVEPAAGKIRKMHFIYKEQ